MAQIFHKWSWAAERLAEGRRIENSDYTHMISYRHREMATVKTTNLLPFLSRRSARHMLNKYLNFFFNFLIM